VKLLKTIDLQDILDRLAGDDQGALKELYEHYSSSLLQLAYAIVRSKEMAEEVVEDVFIKVWQKRSAVRSLENFPFYLYTMTKNGSRSYLRKFGHKRLIDLDDVSLPFYRISITPEDLMISGEALQRINIAINELPTKCRLIFKLVKEDGLKYREVADLLQVNLKTVENQIGIALKKIHSAIKIHLPQPSPRSSR
jgi:RNA polymerase sigma-70 factor (family 1)